MSYEAYQAQGPQLWVSTNRLWSTGEKGMSRLFDREDGTAASTGVPFPKQARTSNRLAYFDHGAIEHAVADRKLTELDPRSLMSGQPSITHQGMRYYMDGEYEKTGRTFADHGAGNAFPVVYESTHPDFGYPERTLMTGHHRATAALLRGEPLRAVHVKAPYLR